MTSNRRIGHRWRRVLGTALLLALLGATRMATGAPPASSEETLAARFAAPPPSARPGVYWYFLDGNRDARGMTEDLQAMARAGIGSAIMLEVDLGVPRGPVAFMSDQWVRMFGAAVSEAKKLGIEITLGSGPGWTGSGGPWVTAAQSMQHLVASSVEAIGRGRFQGVLPVPSPRQPYFDTVTPELEKRREAYHRDVAVLAFLTPLGTLDRTGWAGTATSRGGRSWAGFIATLRAARTCCARA